MLKDILKLDGAQSLSKEDQKQLNGGLVVCANVCGPTGGILYPNGLCWCYYTP